VDQPDTGNQSLRNGVTPGTGGTCTSDDACSTEVTVTTTTTPPPPTQPSLAVKKRVDSAGPFMVGDRVAYVYAVSNTGDTVMNDITVTDDHVSQVTCDATTLQPGANTTCRGFTTITSSALKNCRPDTKAGNWGEEGSGDRCVCTLTNTAYATATDPDGDRITSNLAKVTITVTKESGHEPPCNDHKGMKGQKDCRGYGHGSGHGRKNAGVQHI